MQTIKLASLIKLPDLNDEATKSAPIEMKQIQAGQIEWYAHSSQNQEPRQKNQIQIHKFEIPQS